MSSRLPSSWLPLGAILALAAAVRLQHLGALSYYFDEAFCVKMIGFPAAEIWRRSALDNHPPLYFYLLRCWTGVFGNSPAAARSLSVALGLAAVAGAYLLVTRIAAHGTPRSAFPTEAAERRTPQGPDDTPLRREVDKALPGANRPHPGPGRPLVGPEGEGDSRPHPGPLPEGEGEYVALAAAALVALGPMQVDWSQLVRMYVLGAALAIISCWLLLRALHAERPRARQFIVYALAAAALAYTHHFGLFVVAGQFLYAVGWSLQAGGGAFANVRRPHPGPGRPLVGPEGEGEHGPHHGPEGEGGRSGTPRRRQGAPFPTGRFSHRFGLLLALALVALAYLPWASNFLRQREQVSNSFHTSAFNWIEVAKVCYQTLAARWEDEPPGKALAWVAAAAYLLPAVAMLVWGRGGLRLIGVCLLATFDGAICASIADRNIIQSRYFVFANALLLCGLPPLIAQTLGPIRLVRMVKQVVGRARRMGSRRAAAKLALRVCVGGRHRGAGGGHGVVVSGTRRAARGFRAAAGHDRRLDLSGRVPAAGRAGAGVQSAVTGDGGGAYRRISFSGRPDHSRHGTGWEAHPPFGDPSAVDQRFFVSLLPGHGGDARRRVSFARGIGGIRGANGLDDRCGRLDFARMEAGVAAAVV